MTSAQTNTSDLWKQVSKAQEDDLPQTEQKLLRQIASIAESQGDYAELLKAELQEARSLCSVSPDSLPPAVERLKEREQQAKDSALRAVYCTVLAYVYQSNSSLDEDRHEEIATDYYSRALENPRLLATTPAKRFNTIVIESTDSKIFGNDLLSIIGYEARRYDVLRDCYAAMGNRKAELMASLQLLRQQRTNEMEPLESSPYLHSVDSLIERFADLEECGEAAIERFSFMDRQTNATAEQKMAYIDEALRRWGSWKQMNALRNRQAELTALQYNALLEDDVQIPGQWLTIGLDNLRGIDTLTVRIYSADVEGDFYCDPNRSDDYDRLKRKLTLQPELTRVASFGKHKDYELFDDSLRLSPLPPGVYMIEMTSAPATRTTRQMLFVSNVKLIAQPMPERKLRFVALDATTGQPLPGARLKVTSYTGYYTTQESYKFTADEKGEYIYTRRKDERDCTVFATTATDKYCRPSSFSGNYYYSDGSASGAYASVYADREIYRPGQTVHAAAVFYQRYDRTKHSVEAGKKVTMSLYDANRKMVAEQEVVTDEYGTCAADFKLPKTGLAGQWSIRANGFSNYIRVEEYKRPTFEVEIPSINASYADGDTVEVKGNARSYAGVSVQGAKVKYKVTRRRAFWWFSYYSYWNQAYISRESDDTVLAQGETTTDEQGQFTVDVPIVVPKTRYTMFYNFVVTADVTDQAGETHAATLSLPMGNKPKALSADLPDKMLREEGGSVAFALRNAAGNDIDAEVKYRFDGANKWLTAKTGEEIDIPDLTPGRHTLDAVCEGETLKQEFTVFSLDDTKPAETTDDWFYISDSTFPRDGSPVTLQVGASDENIHVVYAFYAGNKVVESGVKDISNALINMKISYEEQYGNGLLASFAWVKNGKVHTHTATIARPLPDTRLRLNWATFRDRLKPGQQEEWTLTITTPEGKPADAQLMATLYDKSLDQIEPHNWSMGPSLWLNTPNTGWHHESWGDLHWRGYLIKDTYSVYNLSYSHFDHDLYPSRWMPRRYRRMFSRVRGLAKGGSVEEMMVESEPMMMKSAVPDVVYDMAPMPQAANQAVEEEAADAETEAAEEKDALRENMDETAFFMPQLTTDSEGRVAIKFTLPETLTTWRFMGAAHDKQMFCGTISGEAVASKDVMIQPNMPRFMRRGDKSAVTARVFNTSENDISGTARLLLINPEDESIVYEQKQKVEVKKGGSTAASFSVDGAQIPEGLSLLVARVSVEAKSVDTAAAKQYSDGEQHYMPVMPDREHVIVTVPFTQHNPGTKTIDLSTIVPAGATQTKLTAEYTNNPAWMMIQALPAIGHPHDDCAVCQAASFYANSLGLYIMEQNPQAEEVFAKWAQEEGDETSLMSSLAKNQELKDLVLDETPWVADANREEEQKRSLADFFDTELMNQRLVSALEKMKKMQNTDGSWSWWPDMRGSWYMTVTISQMLVRLNAMCYAAGDAQGKTAKQNGDPATQKMLDRAFKFMGSEAVEIVRQMKKAEKEGFEPVFPSQTTLDWLYICSVDGRKLSGKVQQANDYLIELLKKEKKNQSIYGKAMTAIVLASDNAKLSRQYVKSLKEYTVSTEEAGRYYDTPRALYSWRDYRIPTQVVAIEAIQRLTPNDTETIDEMLRWLLHEKRTQAWDTPLSTIDAIYAFLNGRQQLLQPQEETTLAVDGKTLETPKATAGLGYVKAPIPEPEKAKLFTATKTSKVTSWGAVYAQFMQQATEVEAQSSGITVTREILPAEGELKVGDRLRVRITIVADRDYDFVQVIDKRAACMEPVSQKSGYQWGRGSYYEGYYCTPRDASTNYYFDRLAKGRHVVETEYFADRPGVYSTGICTVSCAYSPEFRATAPATTIKVAQ